MEYIQRIYEAILAPTNTTAMLDSATNLFPIVATTIIAIAALAILLYASSSIERFRKFKRLTKIFKFLARSFGYAAYGGLTVVVIAGPCILGYYALQTASDNAESILPTLQLIGYFIGAFVGLAVLGWFMKKKVWSKLFKYHKEEKDQKLYKEQMKELPIET